MLQGLNHTLPRKKKNWIRFLHGKLRSLLQVCCVASVIYSTILMLFSPIVGILELCIHLWEKWDN